ncbi:MAG: ABC-2 family transporter protein [Candidatus Moranbacteria bacterium]|nr:ABC-2 family transporter protein [Candidatus Moranbacteria bacterium]
MKKYFRILSNEIQRQFSYRASIASYALGNIGELLALAIIWTIVYKNIDSVGGYGANEMVSYIVFAWFFSFLTTTYAFERLVARDIHRGTLTNMLVKPQSYIRYLMTVATGRVVIAFLIVLVQGLVVYLFFRDRLIFEVDFLTFILLVLMLIATYFINLFLSILIGFIAFWTVEINGTYYSLKVFSKFMSGTFFPISLLPVFFVKISYFLPFVYTIYIPVQLYLGKISFVEGLKGFAIEILWLVGLYVIIKVVWRAGLKRYESVGI